MISVTAVNWPSHIWRISKALGVSCPQQSKTCQGTNTLSKI